MTTSAQRERTVLRIKVYTGCMVPGSNGRGGASIPESCADINRPGLVQMWPLDLDKEIDTAKPTLALVDLQAILEAEEPTTPRFGNMQPRPLAPAEVDAIRTWYTAAKQQEAKELTPGLAAVQNRIMGQASSIVSTTTSGSTRSRSS